MTVLTRRNLLLAAATGGVAMTFGTDADSSPFPGQSAFAPNDVIVFQGDSITDGGRWYEGQDYNHIMGQDYCYIVAGEIQSQHPHLNLNFINRGVGGNDITNLTARWQTDTLDLKPNFLSILIGVNDALRSYRLVDPVTAGKNYAAAYEALIKQTQAALPEIKIVLGQPFVLPVKPRDDWDDWKLQVGEMQIHSQLLAQKLNLPYIPYARMFDDACKIAPPNHWSWDGVHPTYAGHFLMHDLWIKTVTDFYGPVLG